MKKVSQLPSTDDWSEYISKPLNSWANVAVAECLLGEPSILKSLRGFEDAPRRSFLRECQGYLLELLKHLDSSSYANSRVARSLSALSVDMLFGGDADYLSELFQYLVACLQESNCLDGVEREAASNEFESLVVDLRQRSMDCSQIEDVFSFLETLDSFQCRTHVRQVVRLVRVMVCSAPKVMPHVEVSASGWAVPPSIVRSGISGVQSFVMQPKFVSADLLIVECIEELNGNLLNGHQLLNCATFDPWGSVSRHPYEDIFGSLLRCYTAYYSVQVDGWRARMSAESSTQGRGSAASSGVGTSSAAGVSGAQRAGASSSSQKDKGSKNSSRQGKSY